MQYPLSFTCPVEASHDGQQVRGRVAHVMEETDLGPHTDFGTPSFFCGKLVDVPADQISYFTNAPGVEVSFRGGTYLFEVLELTGSFKLLQRS
jgi:hypothetical protein